MTEPNHIAEARKKVSRPQIREVFLRNGAVIPADRDDLPDYVYESVFELLEVAADHIPDAGKMVAPAVQGEPVGWQFYQHGKWWYGDDHIKDHKKNTQEAGFRVRDVYAAPQPAEQQPVYQRCEYCDGTGDVHSIDGEWRGVCDCQQPVEQQPDPFRGDNVALIRSAQSLLSLDDKGAFGPNGIGGHARNIITTFIARISAEQQPAPALSKFLEKEEWNDAFAQGFDAGFNSDEKPAPDVTQLVEIAKEIVDLHDRRGVVLTVHVEALRKALAAHRKQGGEK